MNKNKKIITNISKILLLIILFFLINIQSIFAFTVEDEIRVGQEASKQLEQHYKILNDPQYAYRVKWIGSLLYKVCPRKDLPYCFKVIDSPIFNALSLPGGFIYVNKGLMDNTTDGELAFIIGHEMAHCAHSHQLHQAEKNNNTQLGLLVLGMILTKGNLGNQGMNAISLANTVLTSSYSRADEKQSDLDSLHYMVDAGIDPRWAVSAFEKMKSQGREMPGIMNSLVGSHPLSDERIQYVEKEIKSLNYKKPANPPIPPYGSDKNIKKQEQPKSDYDNIKDKFKNNKDKPVNREEPEEKPKEKPDNKNEPVEDAYEEIF
jgi:predicted Zn-dependent protease